MDSSTSEECEEITPLFLKPKVHRFGGILEDDAKGNVRAVAEAQIMAVVLHAGAFGKNPGTVLVTAGGSENQGLLSVYEACERFALGLGGNPQTKLRRFWGSA